jgi:hypothetical protein
MILSSAQLYRVDEQMQLTKPRLPKRYDTADRAALVPARLA